MNAARSSISPIAGLPVILLALMLGYFIVVMPAHVAVAAVLGGTLLLFSILKIEIPFMLTLLAIVILCEQGVPGDSVFRYVENFKIVGAPEPMEMAVALLVAGFGARLFLKREKHVRFFVWPVAIYLGVLAAALLTGLRAGNENILLRDDFKKFLMPVPFFLCAYNLLNRFDTRKIEKILLVLFAAIMVKCLVGIVSYQLGHGFLYESYRRVVFLDTPDHILFVTSILAITSLIICNKLRGYKLLGACLLLLPLVYAEIFSFRRNAWLGLIVSLLVMFLLMPMARKVKMIVLIGLTSLLLFMALSTATLFGRIPLDQVVVDRFTSIMDKKESSNEAHLLEYQVTINDTMDSPFWGLGLGSKHAPIPGYEVINTHTVHNSFLMLWMKMGVPGLAVLLWIIYRYARVGVAIAKSRIEEPTKALQIALFSVSGYLLVGLNVGPTWAYYREPCIMAFICALVLVLSKNSRRPARA